MLTIRLTRKGKKNQPFFRVVVIDKKRSAKGGRAVEVLGYVDPLTKKRSFDKDRVLHWIKMGAQPSDTIHNMLVSEKIIDAKKINVSKKSKKPVEAVAPVAPAPTVKESTPEAPVVEAPAVEPAPQPEAPKDMPVQSEETPV